MEDPTDTCWNKFFSVPSESYSYPGMLILQNGMQLLDSFLTYFLISSLRVIYDF